MSKPLPYSMKVFVMITQSFVTDLSSRTLTNPVELIKCLRSIKENVFSTSRYPVIITLEDHLTPYLQAKVAKSDSDSSEDDVDDQGSLSEASD